MRSDFLNLLVYNSLKASCSRLLRPRSVVESPQLLISYMYMVPLLCFISALLVSCNVGSKPWLCRKCDVVNYFHTILLFSPYYCKCLTIIQLQICLRGRNVMMGYLNKPEKTREAIDDEGWLHSGDLGIVDKVRFDMSCYIRWTKKEKRYCNLGNVRC